MHKALFQELSRSEKKGFVVGDGKISGALSLRLILNENS
jgi:hypothetical protein